MGNSSSHQAHRCGSERVCRFTRQPTLAKNGQDPRPPLRRNSKSPPSHSHSLVRKSPAIPNAITHSPWPALSCFSVLGFHYRQAETFMATLHHDVDASKAKESGAAFATLWRTITGANAWRRDKALAWWSAITATRAQWSYGERPPRGIRNQWIHGKQLTWG